MEVNTIHTLLRSTFMPTIAEDRVLSQTTSCGIFGGQGSIGRDFSTNTSVFSCQYHFTTPLYTYFIHLPPTRYDTSSLTASLNKTLLCFLP